MLSKTTESYFLILFFKFFSPKAEVCPLLYFNYYESDIHLLSLEKRYRSTFSRRQEKAARICSLLLEDQDNCSSARKLLVLQIQNQSILEWTY